MTYVSAFFRVNKTGHNAKFVLQLYASIHPRAPDVAAADYISTTSSLHLAYHFQKCIFLRSANEIANYIHMVLTRSGDHNKKIFHPTVMQ